MMEKASPVLVVEDDPDLLLMLTTALELDGRQVVTAVNGRDALRLARTHRPALIVLDLMLPILSGEEVGEALLADEALKPTPVIVVSARHDAQDVAARMNAAGCLTKPLSLEAFVALVNTTLSGRAPS
jgi:DNA-binding response OmpR family regulator